MDTFVLPALLVLLSAILRSFIVNKNSTPSVLGDIMLGLPVDLTFVGLSIVITLVGSSFSAGWEAARSGLIVGILIVAAFQIGALYKPCKEYVDEDRPWCSFGLWVLNALCTFAVFAFLLFEVVA
ncbi:MULTISPECIES: hypothetical protein [Vibrio]|uniref:hypothetical protein n=1 Tax=Vibrio TaxID=662 RepID=UPI000AD9845F|nr:MULTISPECIES: hypothetical protein [Vibrio]EIV8497303.1 hypothetical protein [Vibrio vulnificus]ELE6573000.1 hypothetical protein [Vibrio parahaemolyticus]ELV8674981.1 hypothetical protein [Vibrio vulnificus]MCA3945107.1 hypothetical protein [Vibrio vulnificus]MCG6485280.1 hypothetical protein [Vibrio parahaemolyticus]